jgi:transposase-like protein/IS1 family transposase
LGKRANRSILRADVKNVTCRNPDCVCPSEDQRGRVVPHGFYRTRSGKRRRYRCTTCGKTFSSTMDTPYFRLQHSRSMFDEVASLSVEGVNKSAISRVKGLAWNTVHRWIERATESCRRFNKMRAGAIEIVELRADEIRTFVGTKKSQIWIFAALEDCSRYWPATIVGERNSENARKLFHGVPRSTKEPGAPLIVTDGYAPYEERCPSSRSSGSFRRAVNRGADTPAARRDFEGSAKSISPQ